MRYSMKTGIIVYSKSGNTFSVAEKLKERLEAEGHTAQIHRVTVAEEGPQGVKLQDSPDTEPFEYLIFGSPVHAFSLAPAMAEYLKAVPSLQNKTVSLFVTKHLRFKWTGGNRALGQMEQIVKAKGGTVKEKEVVTWSKNRTATMNTCIEKLSKSL